MLCDVTRLTVLTVSTVPAEIVAALKDETANQPQIIAVRAMNLFCIISESIIAGYLCIEEKVASDYKDEALWCQGRRPSQQVWTGVLVIARQVSNHAPESREHVAP